MDKYLHNADKELGQAYKLAYYKVIDPPIFISLDSKNPELDEYLGKNCFDYQSWVFLTAYNPGSKVQTDEINTSRQAELLNLIRRIGHSYLPGVGGSRDNSWPVEKSVLILNLEINKANELALQFGQKAFLYGEKGKTANLEWTS